MCDRAVILAGGQGTRLRPYTVVLPKPLVPVGKYPIAEILVRQLAACGVRRVTVAVGYHANLIQAYFGDGSKWGVQMDYSLESQPLGTIGPLRLIPDLPDTFLLMNGDILTDLDFTDLWRRHRESGCRFTVAAATRRHRIDYGVLKVDGEVGNKKVYDPRSYLAIAEGAMAERVKQAANDLRGAGKTFFAK